jgi:hypothetical protein
VAAISHQLNSLNIFENLLTFLKTTLTSAKIAVSDLF